MFISTTEINAITTITATRQERRQMTSHAHLSVRPAQSEILAVGQHTPQPLQWPEAEEAKPDIAEDCLHCQHSHDNHFGVKQAYTGTPPETDAIEECGTHDRLAYVIGQSHAPWRSEPTPQSKARLTLFAVLFLVSLLAVLHVISSHTALGITVALMLLCARDVLKKVDYWLLATFVCFFIFSVCSAKTSFIRKPVAKEISQASLFCG